MTQNIYNFIFSSITLPNKRSLNVYMWMIIISLSIKSTYLSRQQIYIMRYNLNNFINNTAIWNLSSFFVFCCIWYFSAFASEHMMDIKLCFNTLSLAVFWLFTKCGFS